MELSIFDSQPMIISGRWCSIEARKAACFATLSILSQLIIMPLRPNLRFLGGLKLVFAPESGRVGVEVSGLVDLTVFGSILSDDERAEKELDTSKDAVANNVLLKFGQPHLKHNQVKLLDLFTRRS
jgi:hypothetical protein